MPKGIYWILRIGLMGSFSSLQKSEFVKLIISFFYYFWCQNWDQWHKMSGKNTHIYFFYFRFKNKQVWVEKIGKERKKSKKNQNLKPKLPITLTFESHYFSLWKFFETFFGELSWECFHSFLHSCPHQMVTFGPTPHFMALLNWNKLHYC